MDRSPLILALGLGACVAADPAAPAVVPTAAAPVDSASTGEGTTVPWEPTDPDPAPTTSETAGMPGFSFVDDTVAGMPLPWPEDVPFLAAQGLTLLVSAREEAFDPALLAPAGISGLHLPIDDYTAPTLEQQQRFVDEVRRERASGGAVGVHCYAGLGRTGTLLATWFVAEGWEPDAAIDEIRRLRPGSIESEAQEASVYTWAAWLRGTP
jgi:atypical dual specificity phosphatase